MVAATTPKLTQLFGLFEIGYYFINYSLGLELLPYAKVA